MIEPSGDDDREPLTARQAEWLEAVRDHYARQGTPPTSRELCEAMGLSKNSNSGALYVLRLLAKKGYLVAIATPGGYVRYIPPERPGGGQPPVDSPRVARAVARLRREAAELRKQAEELERIAGELEGE